MSTATVFQNWQWIIYGVVAGAVIFLVGAVGTVPYARFRRGRGARRRARDGADER